MNDETTDNADREEETRMESETDQTSCAPIVDTEEVVLRYKELQDIERCFRTMKSSLDLRPMFHRVDRRIRAHAFLCVMALQIDRTLRKKLKAAGLSTLPTRVL